MNSKSTPRQILILFLTLIHLLILDITYVHAEQPSPNNILVLNSYHEGYQWTDNIVSGIKDILDTSNNTIQIEYMNTKVINDKNHINNLYKLYKHMYENITFDVIIASDNDAYEFLKLYHEELFSDIPIIVCGLNDYDEFITNDNNLFTGIAENVDVKGTLDLALKFFPDTKNIFIISDNSTFGISNENKLKKTAVEYPDFINFQYIQTDSIDEVLNLTKNLPENSIIYQSAIFKDKFDVPIPVAQGSNLIYESSDVPLFSCWKMHLGNGVIGGKMLDGFYQGQLVGEMAKEILNGKDISAIPFQEYTFDNYIFDYNLLQKYNNNKFDLPKDSIVLNAPSPDIEVNKYIIYLIVIIVIAILSLIILILNNTITKLRSIQQDLKQEKKTLQSILDSTTDGIMVTNTALNVIHFNRKLYQIFKINDSHFNLKAKKDLSIIINDIVIDPNKLISWIESDIKNIDSIQITLKDNRVLECICTTLVVEENANGNVWIFRDITEKKEIEKLEKKVAIKERLLVEAKKYDQMKDQFLATISHELKTPLNIIFGIVQIVDTYFFKGETHPDVATLKKYSKITKQNCYRLLKLINNLIDITKIDSGFMLINLKNYNIVSVIEEISQSIVSYAQSKGLTLIFDTEIEEKVTAIDAAQIERVMLNLFSNAIKFTESGGTIEVNIFDKGDTVLISVKDTGIGIPRDIKDTVFDRFRQVDSSLQRKSEGSGIGLALVKSIIEMHNGTITLNSDLGKGSEFIIELPVHLVAEDANHKTETNTPHKFNVDKINIEFSDIYS